MVVNKITTEQAELQFSLSHSDISSAMAPVRLPCMAAGCPWLSNELEMEDARFVLTSHMQHFHQAWEKLKNNSKGVRNEASVEIADVKRVAKDCHWETQELEDEMATLAITKHMHYVHQWEMTEMELWRLQTGQNTPVLMTPLVTRTLKIKTPTRLTLLPR